MYNLICILSCYIALNLESNHLKEQQHCINLTTRFGRKTKHIFKGSHLEVKKIKLNASYERRVLLFGSAGMNE